MGGGGSENLPFLQMNRTDRLCEMQMKGGGGVKKSENIADVLCTRPLTVTLLPCPEGVTVSGEICIDSLYGIHSAVLIAIVFQLVLFI